MYCEMRCGIVCEYHIEYFKTNQILQGFEVLSITRAKFKKNISTLHPYLKSVDES